MCQSGGMALTPESRRISAHILVDAAAIFDPEADEDLNTATIVRAIEQLHGANAILVEVSEGEEEIEIQVTVEELVRGTVSSMNWLIAELAAARNVPQQQVVADLEAFLDN